MSLRWQPVPSKLAPLLKATKFYRRKILFNSLLQTNNIHPFLVHRVFELGAPPWRSKTPNILDEEPHGAAFLLELPFRTVSVDLRPLRLRGLAP
jgi:hypothetical protein